MRVNPNTPRERMHDVFQPARLWSWVMEYTTRALQGQALKRKTIGAEVLMRKSIHILGAFTLIAAAYLGLATIQTLIATILVLYMYSESLRLSGGDLPIFTHITRYASKEVERTSVVTTPIWYALGILLTISLFPFRNAAIGVLTLTLGDPTASIIGYTINGSNPYSFNKAKSLNGSLAGSAAALAVCLIVLGPSYALLGCLAGMFVEALPLPLNDNITIPVSASIASILIEKILLLM